jgi:hypothetical protein
MKQPTRELDPLILDYLRRGWSIIPMKPGEKKPAVRWKGYQTRLASVNTVRRWILDKAHCIAVVFGDISGGLVCRDFDTIESYSQWASDFPELAEALPTVATQRGRHVYATATPGNLQALRDLIGKPEGTGAIRVTDGELRVGVGSYCVLPPSMHPSGHVYQWLVPLPDGPLPEIDLMSCGFIDVALYREHGENRGHGRARRKTEAMLDGGGCHDGGEVGDEEASAAPVEAGENREQRPAPALDLLEEAIEHAIAASLPTRIGTRHRQVFELARALRGIPALYDAEPRDLTPIVRRFHQRALPHIRTKPFEETLVDFLRGWPRVRFPLGTEPMALVLHKVATTPLPEAAEQFEQEKFKILVSLCRELQRNAGAGEFYLSCRTAGRLIGVCHTHANNWLFLMVQLGVLEEVIKGSALTQRASRYRYLGDM